LTDEQWAQRFQEWVYVNNIQQNAQKAILETTFKESLYQVANDVFKALAKAKKNKG